MLFQNFSLEKKVNFVTILGLIILVGIGWFSYHSVNALFKPFDRITHTQTVLGDIGTLTNQLTNVQTSVRGYLLTGEEKYLKPYQAAIKVIPGTLAEITSETRDNPRQQTNLILLKLQIKTFSRIYARVVRLRKRVEAEKIDFYIKRDSGFDAMNAVMRTINDVNGEEQQLLVLRDAAEVSAARNIRWTIFLVMFLAAAALLGTGVNIARQIVAVKVFNEKLREKETVIFKFLSGLRIGIFVTKADGRTYFANHVALDLLGRDLKPMEDFYEYRHAEPGFVEKTNPAPKTPLALALQGIASTREDMQIHGLGGKVIPVEVSGVPIFDHGGQLTYALTTFTDISERVKHQAELKNLSIRDDLTGLFNRRGFMTLGEQQLKAADRAQTPLLLLFIDLDEFKQVNDRDGHQADDEMLKEFASIISEDFRKVDIVGRLGGDEFAILTEDGSAEDTAILHRVREKVQARNAANPNRRRLDFSAGAASYDPKRPCRLEQLLLLADEGMYAEKIKKQTERKV